MTTPVVIVSGAGTSGQRGNSWLTGAGAPVPNVAGSQDGDFYLDNTNVGFYYGPRTGGLWGTPHPFGNSLNGVPLTNVTATVPPTTGNDSTQGYTRGSYWINTVTNATYTCTNAAVGAAVWQQTIQVGNIAGGDLTGTLPNPTVSKVTGVPVSGTPAYGQGIFATGPTASSWALAPGFFPSTGLASGGVMTFNGGHPTQFNISAGVGYIVDYITTPSNPTVTQVTIVSQTIDLTTFVATPAPTTRTTNWWLVNSSGVISVQGTTPTNTQRRTMVILGVTGSVPGTGVLFNVQSVPIVQVNPANQLYDIMYALGPFSSSGNVVTAHSATGGDFGFNKAAGTVFDVGFNYPVSLRDPHNVTSPAETPAQFKYATQVPGSEGSLVTNIDVTHFDSGGTITAIGGGNATSSIHRVILFGTGVSTQQLAVQYGQATYGTLSAAVAAIGAEPFTLNPDFTGIGYVIAWVCATKSAASLGDTANVTIVQAAKFAVP